MKHPSMASLINQWRIIYDKSGTGAWNMAVDDAILETVARGDSPPTLRLYSWHPPCLSLGYAQSVKDADLARIQAHNWQIVRRPTGGRAILHTDELTYSIIAKDDHPLLSGGVLESYRRLSCGLLGALSLLGLEARADQAYPQSAGKTAVCFETPSNYEITANGKKLIGSAQARRNGGVLQHGSLPLNGDLTRIVDALNYDDQQRGKAAVRLLEHATTLESLLGYVVSWDKAAEAFHQSFKNTFGIDFFPGVLEPGEKALVENLLIEKHANPDWIYRL